jgi:hypothetical protein
MGGLPGATRVEWLGGSQEGWSRRKIILGRQHVTALGAQCCQRTEGASRYLGLRLLRLGAGAEQIPWGIVAAG